ncbi:unnamed protein product [Clonostachys rhizophaga]|uniref:DDHD domain-containing protein n=1 Tax=Clonostachys rhizophaga TaxID=160324 RepID=A0A9N9VRI5_9HYPO|nr:unnamed protein product [Clonostachys rhizophaga]
MGPGLADKKAEKSYLSSAVESINPWAAKRTSSPASTLKKEDAVEPPPNKASSDPGDHATTHLYGLSLRNYPDDCPPLSVQWFHAVDVPKHKPQLVKNKVNPQVDPKAPAQPKKFSTFSIQDSRAIEARYQQLLEAIEDEEIEPPRRGRLPSKRARHSSSVDHTAKKDPVVPRHAREDTHVPVNEDFLFDVDIEQRELKPVYWLGHIYEVRRGTWFFQEGSSLRPCEENLAAQLEEGYLKIKPWRNPVRSRSQSAAKRLSPKSSQDVLKSSEKAVTSSVGESRSQPGQQAQASSSNPQPEPYRLFGPYMNSTVTFEDSTTAWLASDTMLSWVTSSVYERFAGGGYMSGIKLIRGYSEPNKKQDKDKNEKREYTVAEGIPGLDEQQQKLIKRRSAPPTTSVSDTSQLNSQRRRQASTTRAEDSSSRLQRQLSSLLENEGKSSAEKEDKLQQQEEQDMQDYHTQAGESQSREVEHLILVTHGIGQQLGLRMESINFVHDVNVLRQTIKSVYAESADLKALNTELGSGPGNCRVQVLPVCWRHLLDFPKERQKQGEHDLGDMDSDDQRYPSLEDITVEGMAFARSLISDLALDVLLYQSAYRSHITSIVLQECNRIYRLFKERNPEFKGKVHVMGHSLGSAILFDILCRQRESKSLHERKNSLRTWPTQSRTDSPSRSKEAHQDISFNFDVEDFYCLGSPIGLFQMLEGRTIAARKSPGLTSSEKAFSSRVSDESFLATAPMSGSNTEEISTVTNLPVSVSSPKAKQIFNIFHPSDPISYRLEPLISPAMVTLKPQGLPYTKKGIFGNVANQSLTDIGAKVGQSFSGLWSSLSAGIANNMLNRSLGLSNEEVARLTNQAHHGQQSQQGSEENPIVVADDAVRNGKDERKMQLAQTTASGGQASASGNDPTLIDDELETLYSQFQRRHSGISTAEKLDKAQDDQRKARKLRTEESKMRALNRNGRVDYSIQESVLDFNPINTIASHLSYWADVDRPSQIMQMFRDEGIPVEDAPEDEGPGAPRQSYNFAPGYHGIVYRAETGDRGAGPRHDAPESNEAAGDTLASESALPIKYKLQSMKWGLVPFWTKRAPDYSTIVRTMNCRDDSLSTPGGMWATMKERKRCIVLAQGFFEWLKIGNKDKLPHYITRDDGQLMCFAGLWDCSQYEDSDEKTYTYTIITTDSNKQMKFIHDRMPVILEPGSENMRTWLDPNLWKWSGSLQSLLKPFDGKLKIYPVSKEVGKISNDSPSFIIPLDSKENKSNIANFFSSSSKSPTAAKMSQPVTLGQSDERRDAGEDNFEKAASTKRKLPDSVTSEIHGSKKSKRSTHSNMLQEKKLVGEKGKTSMKETRSPKASKITQFFKQK